MNNKDKILLLLSTLTTIGTYIIIIEIAYANGWL
jgi:hypothetical protein